MPQPSSHQPLLSSGHQFPDWPFYLCPNGPFIYPLSLYLLLHLQCNLFHSRSDLGEILIHLSIARLLMDLISIASMVFNSHFPSFCLPSWQTYFHSATKSFQPPLTVDLTAFLLLHTCNNHHRASPTLCPLFLTSFA